MTTPSKRERAAQRPQRYHAVAIRPDGRRTVMLSSRERTEVEAFVATHRPFARSVGGDVVVEPAFLVRITVPAVAWCGSDEDRAA